MKLRLGMLALAALGACGQAAPGNRAAPDNVASPGNEPCAGLSRRTNDNPARPETWTRSEYDLCMAREANKTNPANAELCPDTIHEGRCVLLIL